MAYDDIRISELPSLPDLHNNDLFLIQDVTNDLAHRIDWGRLKNSIGKLSKGIIFPLGTEEEPEIAIGDYTSGIMAEDYGQFAIVTHGEKRFKIVQSGSMELINGNVLIGNYDRQCLYTLVVNNLTTFNCAAKFSSDVAVDGNLDVGGSITGGKNLNIPGNVNLGDGCDKFLVIHAQIRGLCDMDLQGKMTIHDDLWVDNGARILGNVALGTNCDNKLDVYSTAHFRCDLTVDGDLRFGGDLILDGDISIGGGCDNTINLNGDTLVHCDLRVRGDTFLEKSLFVNQNAAIDGNLNVSQDVYLGSGCVNTVYVNGEFIVQCNSFFRDEVVIGDDMNACPATRLLVHGVVESKCDIKGHEDLIIDHNTTLGTDCSDDLLVKATPVFQCDAEFQKSVNISEELYVGGDFTTDSHITNIGDDRGCTNPNLINLHGEVHIDCNLFVSGDVFYDGDLSIIGPDITFGAGCGLSVINLQGYTIAHCDMLVKGHDAPFALKVEGNVEVLQNTEMWGVLNVAGDSAHDSNLFVHEDVLLNLPVPAYDYWEQCECVDLSFPGVAKRGPDQTTFIHGTQRSLCQVYLNDPRWYKDNDGDPHVQETEIYGSLFARANVVLNSGEKHNSTTNCLQLTQIKGRLIQDCTVVLNDTIESSKSMGFNESPNEEKTIIRGDTRILHNLEVGSNCNELTRINNKFEAKCDSHLNENVQLNGGQGASGVTQCSVITDIFGQLQQRAKVELNKDTGCCGPSGQSFNSSSNNRCTIIHGDTEINASVLLNRGCGDLTRVRGKFQVDCESHLRDNVVLNGDSKSCGKTTEINGTLNAHCSVNLNDGCGETTTINGKLHSKCDVQIDGNTIMDGTLLVKKDITGEANLIIKGNSTLGSGCGNTTTLNSVLDAKCAATIAGDLTAKGNTTLGSGCPGSLVTHNAKTLLKATELGGSLKAGGAFGGSSSGTAIPDEAKALTSTATGESCGTSPKWTPIVNSINIAAGGALKEKGNKKTGNLELDVSVCADGGILVDSCGLKLDDKATCSKLGIIMTTRINNDNPGNMGTPGIIAGKEGGGAIGFSGAPGSRRMRLVSPYNVSNKDCEVNGGNNTDLAYFDFKAQTYKNTCIGAGSSKKYMVCNPDGAGQRVQYDDFPDIPKPPFRAGAPASSDTVDAYGTAIDEHFQGNPRFQDRDVPEKFDTSPPTSISTVDVESTLDQIIGTDLSKGITDGVIEWRKVTDEYREFDATDPNTGEVTGEFAANPEPHFPIFDVTALAAIHPALARWDWTDDSYEIYFNDDDYDSEGVADPRNASGRRLKPIGERTIGVTRPNYPALQALLFAAIKRLKSTKADKLVASEMVDAADDVTAAAAGVPINGTYRNGSQLMIRVS